MKDTRLLLQENIVLMLLLAFNRYDAPDNLNTSLSGMNNLNIFSFVQ